MVRSIRRISEKKSFTAYLEDIFLLLLWINSSAKCPKIEFI